MTKETQSRLKAAIKYIGFGGAIVILGFLWKTIFWVEDTKTTNTEWKAFKVMFQDFKSDMQMEVFELKTTVNDFITQHKEEEQNNTQQTIKFQKEQIRILKERNRETAINTDSIR